MTAIDELGITFFFLVVSSLVAMRLKLPPVVGVLLAGAVIGPNALALVKQSEAISAFADIGATLLLFVIGIEFSLSKIIKFGVRALLMTIVKLAIGFIAVYEVALLFGLGTAGAIILGALFSITSTAIFSKLIKEQITMKTEVASLLFAVLIFEDIIAIFILTFVSSLLAFGVDSTGIVISVVKSLAILTIAYFVLQKIIESVFEYISKMKNDETLIFAAFATAALFAFLARDIGLQPSIGAFLAGSLISNLKEFKRIEKNIVPFGLFFSSFFFLSIGMLIDWRAVMGNLPLIALVVIVSSVTKFASVSLSVYTLEKRGRSAIFAGITMLSVGEFSLLIAKEASKFLTFDIIGVTASVVFLTSLISALLTLKRNWVENTLLRAIQPRTRLEGKMAAGYVGKILKEIEPGGELFNVYIRELKNLVIYCVAFIIISGALFLIAVALENFKIANFSDFVPFVIRAAAHMLVILTVGLMVFRSIDNIVSKTVSTFIVLDKKHVELDKKLFYGTIRLIGVMGLFFITPIVISLLRLPEFFSHIAIIPLIIAMLLLWDLLKTLHKIAL